MKWYWKVIIGLGSLILLVAIVNIALNLWIKLQLPKIINRENDSAYFITYKNIQVSILYSTIKAGEIVIVPKAAIKDSVNKSGIYAKVKGVEIKDFKVWNLVFSDKLKARSITIEQPKLVLYSKNKKSNIRKSVIDPFEKVIAVSDVFINHGDLKIIYAKNDKPMLSVYNKISKNGRYLSFVSVSVSVSVSLINNCKLNIYFLRISISFKTKTSIQLRNEV